MTPNDIVLARLGTESVTLGDALQSARLRGDRVFVTRAVEDRLVRTEAAAAGIVVSDADLQTAANAFRKRLRLFRRDETERWLVAAGLDIEDFERLVELDLLRARLAAKVPEAEVVAQFEALRAELDRVEVTRIALPDAGAAEEIRLQIEEDEADPRTLAERHGGGTEMLAPAALEPDALRLAIQAAPEGALVGPIAVAGGAVLAKIWRWQRAALTEAVQRRIARELSDAAIARRAAMADWAV